MNLELNDPNIKNITEKNMYYLDIFVESFFLNWHHLQYLLVFLLLFLDTMKNEGSINMLSIRLF